MTDPAIIDVDAIVTRFGAKTIHDGVGFRIGRGELVAIVGGSGTGKSVLLREIIGLLRPTAGTVRLFGQDVWRVDRAALAQIRGRFGMLFQDGALFSSLTVEQNVAAPLVEHTQLAPARIHALARLRLAMANLPPDAANKMPSELSGGMRKRAALARALALEPELLFLDEPTSGLDPIAARAFDRLVRSLADDLGLTIVLVTHDLDTLFSIVDRVIVLAQGRVIADGAVDAVRQVDNDWIRSYFSARAVEQA